MSDNQYPVFESGQTLTAADLNVLRSFLHERDRLVGRMIGFGVNCGLAGTVAGSKLTISPGLAVDQYGEPLVLATAETMDLPPAPPDTPSYDFISTVPGGFSVVLEVEDTVKPVPSCGEANCAGHAELHTRGVDLRLVAGRVTGTRMDFSGETLLSVEPIRLALDSTPTNSYTTLRDAIATRLTNGTQPLVSPALITKLQQTSVLASDSPGIKGYKCGWLNMVLFATLDLVRCEALMKLGCDRSTKRPGVVLGWVHQVGGAWVFECSYRHAWEPPRGFSQAFMGGTCSDPCGIYRDAVEALLAGYAPPDPVPTGPVEPPVKCPRGSIVVGNKCVNVYYPPEVFPEKWHEYWEFDDTFDPLGPIWNPPYEDPAWRQPWVIYDSERWNYFDDGVLGISDYVGQPGVDVQHQLETFINDGGGIADVRVVSPADAQAMDGYLPAGGASPSDTLVLSVNRNGNVVATGRVAGQRNTRKVSAALPAAQGALAEAQEAVTELEGLSSTLRTDFGTLAGTVSGLQGSFNLLQSDFASYKGGEFDAGGFGARIGSLERQFQDVQAYGTRISTLEGSVNVLSTKTGVLGGGPVVTEDLGRGLVDFTRTTVEAMKTIEAADNPNFVRYTAEAERATTKLETDLATGDQALINESTIEALRTVRTMVKASGVDPAYGRQLDSQLRRLGGGVPG